MACKAFILNVCSFILGAMSLAAAEVPIAGGNPTRPQITITEVPPYGSTQNLTGNVVNVDPADHHVVCYLFLEGVGWWVKPTFASPCTSIAADGTWQVDVTTGGCDAYATKYACYLLPIGEACPLAAGDPVPPSELDAIAVDSALVERKPYPIAFSRHTWQRKEALCPAGPGPNLFNPNNVWVDAGGALHLAITFNGTSWECAELYLDDSLGYGEYRLHLTGRVDLLDPQSVFGLFTWDNWAPPYFGELDFEVSRWGDPNAFENAQFVVQPFEQAGNLFKFHVGLTDADPTLTYIMLWMPGKVTFALYHGHHFGDPPAADLIATWTNESAWVPTRGQETFRMNLWLFKGVAPLNGQGDEVTITFFGFTPLAAPRLAPR